MNIELLIKTLQNPSQMQLMMGELDMNELLIAQSAVRYAITQLSKKDIQDIMIDK